MAHSHSHAHGAADERTSYYLDQLFAIGASGAIAVVTLALWQAGLLGKVVHEKFYIWIGLGGILLLAIVAVRAINIWVSGPVPEQPAVDAVPDAAPAPAPHSHGHGHGEACGHDHGGAITNAPTAGTGLPLAPPAPHSHGHGPGEACGHDHGAITTAPGTAPHSHAHDHGHSHAPGDDHEHGWAPWRYVVLLIPVVLYFLVLSNAAFDREPFPEPLQNPLQYIINFILRFRAIVWEALPFIILGALIAGLVEEFLPQRFITALLPRDPLSSVMVGGLLGLVFPMCECGIVPIMRRLLRKGLPLSCCIAYLLAGPIINVIVLLSTFAAFSQVGPYEMPAWWMVGLRAGFGYITAVVTALIVDRQYQQHGASLLTPLARPSAADDVEENNSNGAPRTLWDRLSNISDVTLRDYVDITVFLILGAALASACRLVFTLDQIDALSGGLPMLSIFLMMLLAVVLCLCSEADAFVAASLTTLKSSAKLAFLVLGPMIDFKLYFLSTRIFRPRLILTIYLSVSIQVFLYCSAAHYFWEGPPYAFKYTFGSSGEQKDTLTQEQRERIRDQGILSVTQLGAPVPGGTHFGHMAVMALVMAPDPNAEAAEITPLQLVSAARSESLRAYYEGKLVWLDGRFLGNDKRFKLLRYKMNCCAADATPVQADLLLDPNAVAEARRKKKELSIPATSFHDKWVRVTGRVHFEPVQGAQGQFVPQIRIAPIKPDEKRPLGEALQEVPQRANPFMY